MAHESFPKRKRIRDPKLLAEIKKRPCLVCSMGPCDPAHHVSRGAGGDDTEANVAPLCRAHHREQHDIGIETFTEKYRAYRAWREGVTKCKP